MIVLVDTSVWVRFLSGRAPYVLGLRQLLERGGEDFCLFLIYHLSG